MVQWMPFANDNTTYYHKSIESRYNAVLITNVCYPKTKFCTMRFFLKKTQMRDGKCNSKME